MRIDQEQVRQAWKVLTEPGYVYELRCIDASLQSDRLPYDKPRTINGYFNDVEQLIAALQTINKATGIYLIANPCQDGLLAHTNNRFRDKKTKCVQDSEIVERHILLLDLDPERKGGIKGIPTTIAESQVAADYAQTIRKWLSEHGWPQPIEIDSGNGRYLVLRIYVDADDNGLIERVLKGLAQELDISTIHIDQTTFNQSRLMRLPGTWNCKGDGTEDRPHRMAKLLYVPDDLQVVPRELLDAIAIPVEQEQPKEEKKQASKSTSNKKSSKKKLPTDYCDMYGVAYSEGVPYNGGQKWQLEDGCPICGNNDHNAFVYISSKDELGYKCSHNSCKDIHWKEFRLKFDPDAYTKEPSTAELLTEIADQARLICTPSGALYARVPVNGHHEIVSINEKGSGFKRWLIFKFKREYNYVPNSDAVSQVMAGIQAEAEFAGEKTEVYTRVAEKDGCIYLDLANDKWQAVEISRDGWRVITCPPVYFRRPNGMLPLPVPTTGGSLDSLKDLIDVKDDKDLTLITAWLVGTLHPFGPYPVLNLNGERGSKKTTATRRLRNIIDPNIAPARTSPKDEREAAITAQNNMIVSFDNLSSMPLWLSDIICRLATGGGYGTRELYSDDSERVFSARRPVIMNGIEDGIVTQSDLLNRTIFVTLQPPDKYRAEEELDELFNEIHPQLLGALLSVASVALRDRKTVRLDNLPRMADFAKWVAAAEPVLGWKPGTFMDAYDENQKSATSNVMESSPVAQALVEFLDRIKKDEWTGTVKMLLDELQKQETYKNAKKAPKAANVLSGHLRRISPSLRVQGIEISEGRKTEKGKEITIKRNRPGGNPDDNPDDKHQTDDPDRQDTPDRQPDRQEFDPHQEPLHDQNGLNPDDPDDVLADDSSIYPPLEFEKKEEKEREEGRPESLVNLSSGSSAENFYALGKRLGYPALADFGLNGGYLGWNGFYLSRRLMVPDVIARLGGAV